MPSARNSKAQGPHTGAVVGFQRKRLWDASLVAVSYFTLTTLETWLCYLYFTDLGAEGERRAYAHGCLASNPQYVCGGLVPMPGVHGIK